MNKKKNGWDALWRDAIYRSECSYWMHTLKRSKIFRRNFAGLAINSPCNYKNKSLKIIDYNSSSVQLVSNNMKFRQRSYRHDILNFESKVTYFSRFAIRCVCLFMILEQYIYYSWLCISLDKNFILQLIFHLYMSCIAITHNVHSVVRNFSGILCQNSNCCK